MNQRLLATGEQLTGEVLGVVDGDGATGIDGDGAVTVELGPEPGFDGGAGVRCSGPLADLVEGQVVTLHGRWRDHARLGRTFEAVSYEHLVPAPLDGLRAFLASETFHGVPRRTRDRILIAFGAGTGRVVEHAPHRLRAEAGLSEEDAQRLHGAWLGAVTLAAWVQFVEAALWPFEVARAAHDRFGPDAIVVAREEPYRLLDAEGLRFAHVDRLARHLGVSPTDPVRLRAGATAAVAEARRRGGHEHLVRTACVAASARLLSVDRLLATDGLVAAVASGELASEHLDGVEIVSTPGALLAERGLADGIGRLLAAEGPPWPTRLRDHELPEVRTDAQLDAVRAAFRHAVSVVAGGPGTGRMHTVERLLHVAESFGLRTAVCTPTERAAARARERLGRPVATIDGLLEAEQPRAPGGASGQDLEQLLAHDLIVVVEASACDTRPASRLVTAMSDGAHLVWVGDPDELPPAGPGHVMRDLVRSGVVEVTVLSEAQPGAAPSRRRELAREIRAGELGALRAADGDVFLAEEPASGALVARVVRAVTQRLPAHLGVELDQIQVLTFVQGGPAGVDALNAGLAAAGGPATAMTVHQARDGRWPVVVLVLDDSHRPVVWRTLLYTAVTRAQRALLVVGQAETLRAAARAERPGDRRTGLARRIAASAA